MKGQPAAPSKASPDQQLQTLMQRDQRVEPPAKATPRLIHHAGSVAQTLLGARVGR